MPNLSAKYLVEKKEIWKNIIPHQKIYTDEKWAKIVIHTVPIRPFSTDDGLYLLGQEIETFNPEIKLMKTPQWLSSEKNRVNKLHRSVVVQLKDQEMTEKAIKFRLFLNRTSVKAEKYRHQAIQCQKYQKFGYLTRECRSNHKCQICAEEHPTKAHKCDIYKVQNNIYPHSAFKCANYGENHRTNSPKCEIVKKITKKYSKKSSSDQKQLDNINWQT